MNIIGKLEGFAGVLYGNLPDNKFASHSLIAGNLPTCDESGVAITKISIANVIILTIIKNCLL
ncbi:MAG: hypothetical protein ABFD00_06725 [Chloroherpetonaceae bacterium]